MFRKLSFDAKRMWKWLHVFPAPEQSPGHHVKRVHITPRETDHVLPKIIERFHGFPKLKTISVGRDGRRCTSWTSQFVGLPQFVTSLRLTEDSITLWQIRDVISQLPNLDDLYLSGVIPVTDRNAVQGMGTTLTARFGGRLEFCSINPGCSDTDIVNMLLEVPTGLHFKDVHSRACLSSTVRVVEACSKTLVKLVYEYYNISESGLSTCEMPVLISYSTLAGHESLNRTFDFSEFPNLEELAFVTPLAAMDLHWLPKAISTLKPTTSPRLSSLRLLTCDRPPGSPVPSMERLGNVTRLVEGFTQVEREFMGAVKVTVPWYPEAEA